MGRSSFFVAAAAAVLLFAVLLLLIAMIILLSSTIDFYCFIISIDCFVILWQVLSVDGLHSPHARSTWMSAGILWYPPN